MGARLTGLALVVGWACFAGGALRVVLGPESRRPQGDLLAYHAAGRVLTEGGSPHDFEALRTRGASTPFVYPPLAWPFARAVAAFDWPTAQRGFLALKLLALLGLALLWRSWLEGRPLVFATTLALGLFGFRLALRVELSTGNVALFEALGLWSAIVLARRHPSIALLPLGLGAHWKLVPLSALPVLSRRWTELRAMAPGLLVLAVVLGASVASAPDGWRRFLEVATTLEEGPPQNATLVVLTQHLLGRGPVAIGLWLLFAAGVAWLTLTQRHRPDVEWVPLALLAWALVLPRFKDYAFVALLPAAAEALSVAVKRWWPVAGLLAVLHAVPLHPYQRLAALLVSWLVLLVASVRPEARADAVRVTG